LESGKIAGFEALVRWSHPERGLLTPDEFIPIAEESGLITTLDRWVLYEACRQLQAWHIHYPHHPALTVNINLSARSLIQDDIVKYIRRVLHDTGVSANHVKIEITESVMMDHTEATISVLSHLRDIGIQLCVDDFGTGYSSLRYLHRFPIHTMKIDRLFISALNTDEESTAITQSIVALGHTLHKEVVAEGVETAAQMAYLQEIRCECGQGYFFSRPVDSTAAAAMLEA
jgi:EAL domain-containing protein (putative c-di-GMP-specific phosphodiesterase class I)